MSLVISTDLVSTSGTEEEDQKIKLECYGIRIKVFHFEQARRNTKDLWTTIIDMFFLGRNFRYTPNSTNSTSIARHFLLRVTEEDPTTGVRTVKPAGTIRGHLVNPDGPVKRYKLSRLAVDKDYRKHRFGRVLVESLNEWVKAEAARLECAAEIECHAQLPVIPFYAKFGYEEEGEEFDEDGAPHKNMILRIPLTTSNP
ncbi:acyl-CoA N-acyltransferase [Mycena maculata]|uniref:Acyl-CoA N-acyltransferase n=1 Tax=Mycena maculata TaxID=230809 RepID=A0AAD7IZY5_9AGAR|nr:acyl-CoA N-acyltransferase [Mycena maculata]